MTAAVDTSKLVRALREATFTAEQAEGLADAIAEVMRGDLATKTDLREEGAHLRTDIREGEFGLKADLRETEARLEARLREVEAGRKVQIEASKADVIKWMFGTIGFQTLIILGAVITLARLVAK
ncbi:DUF1640 domain-containing protein [Beijerinckia sp. L45]|uniref:DUF1640 domain-containing protein n=1 Tax=Beijerinckia sp. L45 TaxID=1641855 RepID=UPI00131B0487|nr:DUF1640 domain-containing protein [Beijerinckia sp. L45]